MRLEQPEWFDVPIYWENIKPWVGAALSYGDGAYLPEDIHQGLLTRRMKLWLAVGDDGPVSCAVTQLSVYPRLLVCSILVCGGTRMRDWLHFIQDIQAWAKAQGCQKVEIPGRDGWTRALRGYGWKPVFTIYRKGLE